MPKSLPSFAAKAACALCLCLALHFGFGQEASALYDVKPGEIPGKPGSIIRVWPLEGGGPSSVRQALAWMGDRFRDAPAHSDCER